MEMDKEQSSHHLHTTRPCTPIICIGATRKREVRHDTRGLYHRKRGQGFHAWWHQRPPADVASLRKRYVQLNIFFRGMHSRRLRDANIIPRKKTSPFHMELLCNYV